MNAFQKCTNTSDAVPLYLPQQLYLKPIARMNVSIHLSLKMMGKTITHYEVMDRLKELIRPDEFTLLKVTKTTLEIIRFEAEVELRNKISRVLSKLDNKMIKLKDFNELMRVRAAEAKGEFPSRHDWDSFFRDAKDMNEMKPGERPDTVHISNIPTKWFVPHQLMEKKDLLPSEKIYYRAFEKFGSIRNIDIPVCDPYRSKMKSHIAGVQSGSFDETDFFEGYVQFKDYMGFSKCMDALRGMKLVRKCEGEAVSVNIYVDFDKSKHLSEGTIRRRDIVRDRMMLKQKEKEDKERQIEQEKKIIEMADRQKEIDIRTEKEQRRREREEKRKARILAQLKVTGSDDISDKIAREERKLVKVQRRLEAIRLVEALFKRIKIKLDKDPAPKKTNKNDELTRMKEISEHEVKTQRAKLHNAIEGRVILKSIIAGQTKGEESDSNSSSESTLISEENDESKALERAYPQPHMPDMNWYGYLPNYGAVPPFYNPGRGFPYYFPRGRGAPGPSGRPYGKRPYNNRGRMRGMNHYIHQEYYKYAQNILRDHVQQNTNNNNRRYSRSYSRSRSRSRSRTRSRSYSRHRTRTRSKSRSRSRSYSKGRHSRHRSRSKSKSRSRSRRRSVSSKRTRTPPRTLSRTPPPRSRSKSKPRH